MKKIILTIVTIFLSFLSFSQQAEKVDTKVERIKLVKDGGATTTQDKKSVKKVQTPAQELESCKIQLKALDTKEKYIRNNPEELQLATKNGWFENAEKTRIALNKRIKELTK